MRSKYYLFIKFSHNLANRSSSQSGFAMPLAIGMGLVMMIVAASMIGRSQSDRIVTNSQRETNRALSVAETGVVRFQAFLDRHQLLATKNLDKWSNTLNNLPPAQASCRSINLTVAKQQSKLFENSSWINLDDRNQSKGRYKIVNYQYQAGVGKLTVVGETYSHNNSQNRSKSSLIVSIPISSESAKIAPPALWASTFNLNPNQKITGQIRGLDCPQLSTVDADGIIGVDVSNIALINGISSGQIIADPFTTIPGPKVAPSSAILLPAITGSIKLPRLKSLDLPDVNKEYHYLIDIDNPSSNHSIKLQDLDRIDIDVSAGQKVNLYLKGNIDLAGSQTINVNAAHPNLRIYGSPQTLKLTIKDTASITAFIHAPFADASSIFANSSKLNQNITGALWVKSWNSATSPNEIPIIQSGDWSDFGISKIEQPSQISPISYWQRAAN